MKQSRRMGGGDAFWHKSLMTQILPRLLPLEGASNLRDLGGWRGHQGQALRHGALFRSDALHRLTDQDLMTLEATGLSTVCDLRGTHEAAASPSRLPPGARAVPLPIEPRIGASLRDLLANGAATRAETTRLLGVAYLNYATEQLPVYRKLCDLILEDERRPLLFHCSALILTALGVSREQILADYVATDRFWRRDHPLPDEAPQEAKDAILETHPALLTAALEAAVAPFGSEAGLLEDGLGLTPARLAGFRAVLLD
jgi:protein-tyrosine phosphatase